MLNFDMFTRNIKILYSFNINYKDTSCFMKIIGMLLFFNKTFMTNYVTTIGNTIYFPNKQFIQDNQQESIEILSHELVHIKQAQKWGKILFSILYLFPQCLAIFALLAPVSLWFLLFLLFLAPLPAPWRMYFEVGGYTMSLFVIREQLKAQNKTDEQILSVLLGYASHFDTIFSGSGYWFMWPFGVSDKFEKIIVDIMNDNILAKDTLYKCVKVSLK
jgi:hypothetical protein